MFFGDLCLVDRAMLTKTVGKPFGNVPIQCPGECFHILGVIGRYPTVDRDHIVQTAEKPVFLLVHQLLRVNGAKQ